MSEPQKGSHAVWWPGYALDFGQIAVQFTVSNKRLFPCQKGPHKLGAT